MNIIELIERKSNEMREGECWTITNKPSSHGYVHIHGRKLHRVAWEAHNAEPIPDGMIVCHTCDNRSCFNPDHLFLGTHQDNIRDMWSKDRQSNTLVHAERKYNYSLIHEMYNDGSTVREIADAIGADWSTVKRVIEELLF